MRNHPVLTAVALLAIGTLAPAPGSAQGSPTPEQIVKSLTPTSISGPERGIRVGPAVPRATSAASVSLIVQFASGSAELTPQAIHILDNLGKALTDPSLGAYRFRIEGHTDTVGTRDYNKALSERRAAAVRDYLAANFHVDPGRVEAVGMGEDGLLIPTPDQIAEPRNRRVQVVNLGS